MLKTLDQSDVLVADSGKNTFNNLSNDVPVLKPNSFQNANNMYSKKTFYAKSIEKLSENHISNSLTSFTEKNKFPRINYNSKFLLKLRFTSNVKKNEQK